MEYLDELDDSAMQALIELGGDFGSPTQPTPPASAPTSLAPHRRRCVEATYLLRLEHPLSTSQDVADALGLSRLPQLETGTGEDGEAAFCRLSQSSINKLDEWTVKPKQKFTKIRLGFAHKDAGQLPFLGRDLTLPHRRPSLPAGAEWHLGREYPVYYFFYGTLGDSERLVRLFGVPAAQLPALRPATLLDGCIQTWAGKYRALVDWPGGKVEGSAFLVASADQEDALRVYEGDSYEVVTAKLLLEGREIVGRTFRFAGFEDELTA
jgi:hypothetical protein